MTGVILNPGTGSVYDYGRVTIASARANMRKLLADAQLRKARVSAGEQTGEIDGRFTFVVTLGKRRTVVDMPGIKLALVRWMDEPGQNIWHFPRLYVDGNSYAWKFSIWFLRKELTGKEDP